LLKQQNPQAVLSRDYIPAYKLLELYDVEEIFVCADSLSAMGLTADDLILDAEILAATTLSKTVDHCDVVLRF
jgi:tRNA 2-thiouridine synthesizing protein C